ncbi:MAG: haloacid dehalogenase-like hydrolase, partial [Clostridia bacterium]|nr:haloacid dehalogenase-like hydrolase [Clostridia bacterium]
VETWFDRINAYGKELGLNVEHYIISSGMAEMIEGTAIAKNFKAIFACKYIYNEKNEPIWVGNAVNYTNKTQYIFKIRKHDIENLNDSKVVNSRIPREKKIPFSNMVYFGDGFTDIPCMTVIKEKGGNSVCVYKPNVEKSIATAKKLYCEDRVQYIAPTDYSENSELDLKIKDILRNLSNKLIQKIQD